MTILVLFILIVLPPYINISRFRRSILGSISAGLGRPVEASSVELRLFPLPGFVLTDLTVAEDPAFGAEPVMTAARVRATLRPSTLWHRRVEIARLSFDAPSVNLVRDEGGDWNFESLLRNSPALQGRRAAASPGRRMPFPYVEANEARINFKQGAEKLPFSLEQARLALWNPSGHDWRVRLRARPVRTDLTVMDAGEIRGQGSLTTGGPLFTAPVRLSLEWRRVELGVMGELLRGEDNGWRGVVDWTAAAEGTLSDVRLRSSIAIKELRRAEFIPANRMDVAAECDGRAARDPALDTIFCNVPLGDGRLLLRARPGLSKGAGATGFADFDATMEHAPAEYFLELLRHVHPGVAPEATATGEVNGQAACKLARPGAAAECLGELRSAEMGLRLPGMERVLRLAPLVLTREASDSEWKLAPVEAALGGDTPTVLSGSMNAAGLRISVTGGAELEELQQAGKTLRIPVFSGEVESLRGAVRLALQVESSWLPESPVDGAGELATSRWTGSMELKNARVELRGWPHAVQLAAGTVSLAPGRVTWSGLTGSFARIPFQGSSLTWQTPCPAPQADCGRRFMLHFAELNAGRLEAALGRGREPDLLNRIDHWAAAAPWAAAPAGLPPLSGTVTAATLVVGKMAVSDASLSLRLAGSRAGLTALSGKVFGGSLMGMPGTGMPGGAKEAVGSLTWGVGAPGYALHAKLDGVQPDNVGAMWGERWGRGTAAAEIELKMAGSSAAELEQSAAGKFSFVWRNGALDSIESAALPGGRFSRFNGVGTIRDGRVRLDSGRLAVDAGRRKAAIQSVTGTVTFGRKLDLVLDPSGEKLAGALGGR